MNVIICRPNTFLTRRIAYCPNCRTKRRMVDAYAVWYGTTRSCCGCGDSWDDGELRPRPFKRGWRTEAIARAKAKWDASQAFDGADFKAWYYEQLGWDE